MQNRWSILAVLFCARMTMAFQFQSVATLSPLIIGSFGVSLADIGLLIGLYLVPGILVSIPAGAIAARFGDKRVVGISIGLMFTGGLVTLWAPGWGWMMTGRVLAGVGGIVLNLVMTKMVYDWFAGREISTAMAIYVNSWPVGIALALLILPVFAATGGLALAWAMTASLIAVFGLVFVLFYRTAPMAKAGSTSIMIRSFPALALFLAGAVWALYNAALAMVFSFGPTLLVERGLSLAQSSSMTSIFLIVFSVAVPVGGLIADRTGRRDAVSAISLVSYAVLIPFTLVLPVASVPAVFLVAGFLFGLGAGPIVGLPALILRPEARAFAMGSYFALYYMFMMTTPVLAGAAADAVGSVGIVFQMGVGMMVVALLALWLFRRKLASLPVLA